MQQKPGKSLRPRWPWSVVRARQINDPGNPIRYGHTYKLAVVLIALAVVITIVMFPASAVEKEMGADVEAAKLAGFPQLPPAYALPSQISEFMEEWDLTETGVPSMEEIEAMSDRVGKYNEDSSLLNLGLVFPLIAIAFVSAIAFSRALNNVFSLGFKASAIPPTWAAVGWFVPVLSFVLPWKVVAGIHNPVIVDDDGERVNVISRGLSIVAAIWGVSFIGLWLLNPVSVPMLFPRNDIDGWLTNIVWQQRMMMWLPITSFITAFVLLAISIRQHRQYRVLEAEAAKGY